MVLFVTKFPIFDSMSTSNGFITSDEISLNINQSKYRQLNMAESYFKIIIKKGRRKNEERN